MKKIISIFATLLLMLSGLSAAFAQDIQVTMADSGASAITGDVVTNVSVDTETSAQTEVETQAETNAAETETVTAETSAEDQTEVETNATEPSDDTKDVSVMTDHPGVQLRVTQLQERIERAVLYGSDIIATIKTKGNASTSDLEAIVSSLKDLETKAGQIDTSADVSQSTAQFVDIKKQAITLVQEFREKARALLGAKELAQLKNKIKGKEAEKLKDKRSKIKQARDAHNSDALSSIAERLGVDLSSIAAKLKSGEMTPQEARKAIQEAFAKLSSEKKTQARAKLQEKNSELRVKRLANLERIKGKLQTREGKVDARIAKVKSRIAVKGSVETKDNSTGGSNE